MMPYGTPSEKVQDSTEKGRSDMDRKGGLLLLVGWKGKRRKSSKEDEQEKEAKSVRKKTSQIEEAKLSRERGKEQVKDRFWGSEIGEKLVSEWGKGFLTDEQLVLCCKKVGL